MSNPENKDIAPLPFLRDRETELPVDQQFKGATRNQIIDRFAVMLSLMDKSLKWIHSNLQNNNILMKILHNKTWLDIETETFRPLYDNDSPELSDIEREDLRVKFKATHDVINNINENYIELRLVAKGFRAKQIERMITGDAKDEKELNKIFKGKGDHENK